MELRHAWDCTAESTAGRALNQLVLEELGFPEERTLENFVGRGNEEALQRLETLVGAAPEFRLVWLAGGSGTGKSHLVEAMCRAMRAWPASAVRWQDWSDAARETEFATMPFLAIDDVHRLFGERRREQWLMHVIDVRRHLKLPTLFTSGDGPIGYRCALRDLRTRLGMAEVVWLDPLSDEVKIEVLAEFARARGFRLSADVLRFILSRHNRNLGRLMALVRSIDRIALAKQRPVTVPLVREILREAECAQGG